MFRRCLVCGNLFDTTKTRRYKYCSENCAKKIKSGNNNNYPKDLSASTISINQYEINHKQNYDTAGDEWSERIDKIKTEITQLPITDTAIRLVTEILDKYKTKSEDKDGNSNYIKL